jgi:hypothetical protein
MKQKVLSFLFLISIILYFGCEETSDDPNSIGGQTDIDLNKTGNTFGVSITMDGGYQEALSNVEESVFITKSNNGIVTISAEFTIDEGSLKTIDTLLGTQDLSEEMKHTIVDAYLERFDLTLDTTDKQNISLSTELKGKITSEGIQDFVYSKGDESKPFTLIKYNAKVGDKYTFTDNEGKIYTREVTYKSSDDDYELGFIYIKVFKIEETQPDDPMIDKIIYYANHKFGLVGVDVEMKNGMKPTSKIFPWDVLP